MRDTTPDSVALPWTVVLPVKRRTAAKTRLAATLGLDQQAAGELAIAFALDTLAATSACRSVVRCLVVTDDADAADLARAEYGAEIVTEQQPPERAPGFARLNSAFRLGASYADPTAPLAVLTADLAALRTDELERALAAAIAHSRAFVPDRHGTGTSLLTARTPAALAPRFGADSAAAHRASGAVEITDALPSLRLDIDTAQDLELARSMILGVHTAEVLAARPCAG